MGSAVSVLLGLWGLKCQGQWSSLSPHLPFQSVGQDGVGEIFVFALSDHLLSAFALPPEFCPSHFVDGTFRRRKGVGALSPPPSLPFAPARHCLLGVWFEGASCSDCESSRPIWWVFWARGT